MRLATATFVPLLFVTSVQAQECERVGAETCINGAINRCMQTGAGVNGWVVRAPYEKCQVRIESINGKWSGSGHQSPVGASGRADYGIVMTINGSSGVIEYPDLNCGGTVTRTGGGETSGTFREHIDHGRCTDGGTITVNLRNGQLAWSWSGASGHSVIGVLGRAR